MSNDLLVEIGTEELPPKALRALMDAFGRNLANAIDDARLTRGEVTVFSSPRRLAVVITDLAEKQADREIEQKGPPVRIAFDDAGKPTPAATAFAKKCGVAVSDLQRAATDKGEWLIHHSVEPGRSAAELLPPLIDDALASLPIPRRMRWGASDTEFVRPLHWVLMLHGEEVIDGMVMGLPTGRTSQGHRFHSKGAIEIASPAEYLERLEKDGFVIADFEQRRERVREGVEAAAASVGGAVVDGEALYDEVTALVEWPVPIVGRFDEQYLELPREVIISTLTGHQRYFPLADKTGKLLPHFITVANIDSKDPDQVREGNERVVRPRLADAAFFWDTDRRTPLAGRRDGLREVVYQRGLGSLFDKSQRIEYLTKHVATLIGASVDDSQRASQLAKCDLLTDLVGEFPELQGTMGRYYAAADGEPDAVATAIGEHYRPRFAGDELPTTPEGQALAVADKLDTLAGVFSIGKKPSGNRDPFGLRRAALGVIRILVECRLDIDLSALIRAAVDAQPAGKIDNDEVAAELGAFVSDRLRGYFLDRDASLNGSTFDAVMARQPASLVDFDRRLAAVQTFARLEQAESLAAANKRIANILKKAGDTGRLKLSKKLLKDDAERTLYNALENAEQKVRPQLEQRQYADALNTLADLRDPVDRFFDDVMVMADDETVRDNRLALLGSLRALFLDVADISRLSLD